MVQRSDNTAQMDAQVFLSISWPPHAIVAITYDHSVLCIKSQNLFVYRNKTRRPEGPEALT